MSQGRPENPHREERMANKQLLGIIGSCRRTGNCEIVVKAAAEAMKGWDLSMIRLPHLSILPCKGCYACLMPGIHCTIPDDMEWLLEKMSGADAIIFAVPNYVLGPVGIMKMLADRALQSSPYHLRFGITKTAVALTLGREDYRGYADTALVAQVTALGLDIRSIELFHGTHPGEIALEDDFPERIGRVVSSLLEDETPGPIPGRCPRCKSDLFRLRDGFLECALCKSRARIDGERLDFYYFHPEFGEEGRKEHMKWLLGKKEEYGRIRERLSAVRERYAGGTWLTPDGK